MAVVTVCEDVLNQPVFEGSGDIVFNCPSVMNALTSNAHCESYVVNDTITDLTAVCSDNCTNLIHEVTNNCPNMVRLCLSDLITESHKSALTK